MIVYPASFPCASRVEGHSASQFAGLVRSPMEAGNSRQRRSHRVLPHQITLAFVMPQPDYAAWLTWVNAHAWDDWVQMNLPGLTAGHAGTDTAPILVRFCTDLRSELLPAHGLWYWRVRVDCEYQPTDADLALPVPPPVPSNILLGLHLNGDLSDASPRELAFDTPPYTSGSTPGTFTAGAGAYGQKGYRFVNNPMRSLDLPAGGGNLGAEWQFSGWLRATVSPNNSEYGGAVISVNARAHANGDQIPGAPPTPHQGQLFVRTGGNGAGTYIDIRYPGFNAGTGAVEMVKLKAPSGDMPHFPTDGLLHHVGIACDATSVRAYIDGALIATDADPSVPRPAGARPMWTGTDYADQYFLLGMQATGSYDGVYGLEYPWGAPHPAYGLLFAGEMSELLVTHGAGSVTFKGSSIAVPTEPFPDPDAPPPATGGLWIVGGRPASPAADYLIAGRPASPAVPV